MESKLLTPIATAERLGVTSGTLAKWRVFGTIGPPYVKIGRLVRYDEAAIAEWLAKHVRISTSDAGEAPRKPVTRTPREPSAPPSNAQHE